MRTDGRTKQHNDNNVTKEATTTLTSGRFYFPNDKTWRNEANKTLKYRKEWTSIDSRPTSKQIPKH